MEVLVSVGLGALGVALVCGLSAAAIGRAPDLLAGLFAGPDRPAWPRGVQEEDLPPAFGSRVHPLSGASASAEEEEPRNVDGPSPDARPAARGGVAWRGAVRPRVEPGTARR